MHEINPLPVEMELHGLVKGDMRPGLFRIGVLLIGCEDQVDDVILLHHFPRAGLGNAPGSLRTEGQIAFRVIKVPVSVDGEINPFAVSFAPYLADRGFDLRHEHWKLIVYDQNAIIPDADRDVAARTKENV